MGLPGLLIVFLSRDFLYAGYMIIYLLALPIWNIILPLYAFWHFDDFSWGQTRMVQGETKCDIHGQKEGFFEMDSVIFKKWIDWEMESKRATPQDYLVSAAKARGYSNHQIQQLSHYDKAEIKSLIGEDLMSRMEDVSIILVPPAIGDNITSESMVMPRNSSGSSISYKNDSNRMKFPENSSSSYHYIPSTSRSISSLRKQANKNVSYPLTTKNSSVLVKNEILKTNRLSTIESISHQNSDPGQVLKSVIPSSKSFTNFRLPSPNIPKGGRPLAQSKSFSLSTGTLKRQMGETKVRPGIEMLNLSKPVEKVAELDDDQHDERNSSFMLAVLDVFDSKPVAPRRSETLPLKVTQQSSLPAIRNSIEDVSIKAVLKSPDISLNEDTPKASDFKKSNWRNAFDGLWNDDLPIAEKKYAEAELKNKPQEQKKVEKMISFGSISTIEQASNLSGFQLDDSISIDQPFYSMNEEIEREVKKRLSGPRSKPF